MTPLVIVPARVGSKGVPNKNFRELPDGTTLTQRAAAMGLHFGDVVVTTDYPRLGDITLPFNVTRHRRPAELASDTATMQDVVLDVLAAYPGEPNQPISLLQPTTPFRSQRTIQKCLHRLYTGSVTVTTAYPVPQAFSPDRVVVRDGKGFRAATEGGYGAPSGTRRQDARQAYVRDGQCYVFARETTTWWDWTFYEDLLVMDEPTINIDTELDWQVACARIRADQTPQTDA